MKACFKCGRTLPLDAFYRHPKSEAHHPDFAKPLDVRWLCLAHHRAAHGAVAS